MEQILFSTQLSFFALNLLLALSPGPDNIFVLTQSASHGAKAGFIVTLGLCTGLIIHTLLIGLGVSALIQNSPFAFNGLKFLGGCYLLYLAWLNLKAAPQVQLTHERPRLSTITLYRRGLINNITNPKVIIAFLALFPQFIKPELGSPYFQLFILGVLTVLATLIVFGAIALVAGKISERFSQSAMIQRRIDQTAALIFIGLAINLLISFHS